MPSLSWSATRRILERRSAGRENAPHRPDAPKRENAGVRDRPGRVHEASLQVTKAIALHIATQYVEGVEDFRVALEEPW